MTEIPSPPRSRHQAARSIHFGRHQFALVVNGALLLKGFILDLSGLVTAASVFCLLAMATAVVDVDLFMLLAAGGAVWLGGFGEAAALLYLTFLGHALEDPALQRAPGAIAVLGRTRRRWRIALMTKVQRGTFRCPCFMRVIESRCRAPNGCP